MIRIATMVPRGPLALLALGALGALGGCNGHQAKQLRTAVIPLGSPVGGCDGVENLVRGDRSTKIVKSLLASGGCRYRIRWSGALLDISALSDGLKAGEHPAVEQVELRFEPLTLTDEVGQPIAVTLPALRFELGAGAQTLLSVEGKQLTNPLGPAKTVRFEAALRAALAAHLAKHTPFRGDAELTVELSEKARKALAAKSRGPLLELRFVAEVRAKPAAKTDAAPAAIQPATSQPATSQPAASQSAASQPAQP